MTLKYAIKCEPEPIIRKRQREPQPENCDDKLQPIRKRSR